MPPERHLLLTHLDTIAQRTGLDPGLVNPQDPALLRDLQPGYWLEYDYILTGGNYQQPLAWRWVESTHRIPADRHQPTWTERRELSEALAQGLRRLVGPSS